ncbi:hypothetical protein M9Y10_034318 [Tritrichomonas musculus]|uniref:RRM domain-containing protein n=1 Tax=Tritrichomonas musculus TaxID=1915356 RepID=A0ABR2KEK8_9EUKA
MQNSAPEHQDQIPPKRKISRKHPPPPPQAQPRRIQAPRAHQRTIFSGNYVPSFQDLPDVPPQGPESFSQFVKFANLDEARHLASTSGSSNDGCYLLIPVKFIGRIRNHPRIKPICGYYLQK